MLNLPGSNAHRYSLQVSVERFEWYYMGASGEIGPLSESQLLDLADHAAIKGETLVWKIGMESWVAATSVPKIAARMQPTWSPPPAPGPKPPPIQASPPKQSMTCPKDGARLAHTNRNGIEIEYCPSCRGVWLDRGEMDKLIEREVSEYSDSRRYRDEDRGDWSDRRQKRRSMLDDVFDIFD